MPAQNASWGRLILGLELCAENIADYLRAVRSRVGAIGNMQRRQHRESKWNVGECQNDRWTSHTPPPQAPSGGRLLPAIAALVALIASVTTDLTASLISAPYTLRCHSPSRLLKKSPVSL